MQFLKTLTDTVALGAEWFALERPGAHPHTGARSGRHLALFAAALPPSSSAGVYRPLSFMRYGSRLGWRIDAFAGEPVSGQNQHGDELLSLVPDDASIRIVPVTTRQPSYRIFPRVDGGFTNALAHARYAIDSLANDPPDVVLASGPPFFTFVAALLVARRFGAPLVLDYRDEWTECPFDFVSKDGNDRAWERRCLSAASAVLFTTKSHQRRQLEAFPNLDARKTHVVPNGWEPEDFVALQHESRSNGNGSSTMRIAHVGNLSGHATPVDFLDSLAELLATEPEWISRLKIQFIGRRSITADKAIKSFAFPSVLEIIDHVGKREASQRMQESDVLLLIANPSLERYLPGKLFDYLAARRPVLVFGSKGESSELIDDLHAGVLCPSGSGAALRDALLRLKNLDVSGSDATVDHWLADHRREALASRAFGIIDTVAARA
ncbi:MAG TPA: glycosyltransferase [Gemmatimonadaceae bacterium]|nr:glycosyltransferase [Gemmatimonadaceae bacterium]